MLSREVWWILKAGGSMIALTMQAVRTLELSVNICHSTWDNIPEHNDLQRLN
jgi:hypothetical protein